MRAAAVAGNLSLGIDCGTSGARSIVIDGVYCILHAAMADSFLQPPANSSDHILNFRRL